MSEIRFPRWLAAVGVLGGVAIALIFPLVVLMLGEDLSATARLSLSVLGLLVGSMLAGTSAVIGIAIPTSVSRGMSVKNDIVGLGNSSDCCQPRTGDTRDSYDAPADESS